MISGSLSYVYVYWPWPRWNVGNACGLCGLQGLSCLTAAHAHRLYGTTSLSAADHGQLHRRIRCHIQLKLKPRTATPPNRKSRPLQNPRTPLSGR